MLIKKCTVTPWAERFREYSSSKKKTRHSNLFSTVTICIHWLANIRVRHYLFTYLKDKIMVFEKKNWKLIRPNHIKNWQERMHFILCSFGFLKNNLLSLKITVACSSSGKQCWFFSFIGWSQKVTDHFLPPDRTSMQNNGLFFLLSLVIVSRNIRLTLRIS
jgi:hypothetical protein